MQLYYSSNIQGDTGFFPPSESLHLSKVMRAKIGEIVHLTNGSGEIFTSKLTSVSEKETRFKIIDNQKIDKPWSFSLHIAISPVKQADRFEFFLEKATEIGIDEITPLFCHRTEKKQVNNERIHKIILASVKQSFQAYCPVIHPLTPFSDFIRNAEGNSKFIAYCEERNVPHLSSFPIEHRKIILLIGPEGDFTSDEVKQAINNNFKQISLGVNRLRVETAGIAAVQILHTCELLEKYNNILS